MKIITLIDNVVYGKGLIAEHGFSLYIEINDKKILFDTGQSKNFILNASLLGVDLSEIDYCIISHGHYDHTGGLEEFCRINKKASVFIKKEALDEKYKIKNEYIGIPFDPFNIKERFVYVDRILKLTDEVLIIPEIKVYNDFDTHFKNMFVKKDGNYISDEFSDEQFLVLKDNNSLIIISGCSHRGITNIIRTAKETVDLPFESALGGFHLRDENEENILKIIDELNKYNIKDIAISHCSGVNVLNFFAKHYYGKFSYNHTGNKIII